MFDISLTIKITIWIFLMAFSHNTPGGDIKIKILKPQEGINNSPMGN